VHVPTSGRDLPKRKRPSRWDVKWSNLTGDFFCFLISPFLFLVDISLKFLWVVSKSYYNYCFAFDPVKILGIGFMFPWLRTQKCHTGWH
jgi:hypothetical protein